MLIYLAFIAVLLPNVLAEDKCPDEWSLYAPENKCVKVFLEQMEYDAARETCKKDGGDFVQIYDDAKNKFLGDLMAQQGNYMTWKCWIGIYKLGEQIYGYANGTLLSSYHPWSPDNTGASDENCVILYFHHLNHMSPVHLTWYSYDCTDPTFFACERDLSLGEITTPKNVTTTTSPSDVVSCPNGWVRNDKDGVCLKAVNDVKKTFDGARAFCQQEGGDLVTLLDNKGQMGYVKNLMKKNVIYWIGLRAGTFTFVNGKILGEFQPFNKGEPSNKKNKKTCVEMKNTKWWDQKCTKKRNFICQINLQ